MKSFFDYLGEQKLKGDQHKLDINKNGKLDKFDFEALNKKVKKEYVDDQGKLVEKPKVKQVADYDGPNPKTPPDKKSAAYRPANDNVKSPTIDQEKNGLGEMGDKKLKYEPNTEYKQEVIKSYPKTEGFLKKTKGMSLSEFTKYMLDECGCGEINDDDVPYVTSYTTGKFQPHPPEAIKYVVVLANKNENILQNVIREMKSSGMLGKLIRSLFENPEAYDELTNLFGDPENGQGRCRMFARSMNNSLENFIKDQNSMYESVSSPIGFNTEEDEDDDMDMEDDDMDMEDDDMDMEDDDMEMEDDMDMEDDDMDMEDDDMDMEDDDMDMEDDDMDMEDDDMDMEDDDMDMEDDDMKHMDMDIRSKKMPKIKKKFAHNNLMDAMKEFNF